MIPGAFEGTFGGRKAVEPPSNPFLMEHEAACGCSHGEEREAGTRIAVAVSGVFTGLGLLLERLGPPAAAMGAMAAFAVALLAGGIPIFPKAWQALRRRVFDMNVLMAFAVAGAFGIGQWGEAATVVFLFALSEMLEAASLDRARHAVRALMQLAPEKAWVRAGPGEGGEALREVAVESVPVGSTIVVRSGARIPLDGVVASGRSSVDQAPITGESLPVEKSAGDEVFAGTINGEGSLEIRTTRPSSETTLARIVHLVGEAQAHKAPTQRFIDRFAAFYTPAVLVGALLVMVAGPLWAGGGVSAPASLWATWFYRGLVLLVIACPCALVIATPVSIVSALTALARRGVLVKGGAALEALARMKALAVDKTGTITVGKPGVSAVHRVDAASEEEILRIAAAIDIHSTHPIARAVVEHAQARGLTLPRAEDYRAHGGQGAEATVEGHAYFVGNHRFTHAMAVCSPEIERRLAAIEEQAQSAVVVGHRPHAGCRGEVLGILAVSDAVRGQAPAAIAALHRLGVRPVVMLSGDNSRTVTAIARQAGIDDADAYGDLLPERKTECLRALIAEHGSAGMLGDGVNDAPALAAASVGIAMGRGTDAALETADVALMRDDLGSVAEAIRLGRRTLRIVRANIVFALGVKALFLVLAVAGAATLWMAILADTGATLLVIANALRLLRGSKQPSF